MNTLGILHVALASYLTATLGATALAKLKNWQICIAGMWREGVIPGLAVPAVLGTVIVSEFSLATLLAFDIEPVAAGLATAALFVLFAGYRLVVALRTKSLMCSCSGTIRSDPASPPVVAGAMLACLALAVCACLLAFGRQWPGYPVSLLAIASWIAPIIGLVMGARRRPKEVGHGTRLTGEFFQLGTTELRTRW